VTLTSLVDDIHGDLIPPLNSGILDSTCELVTIAPGDAYSCTFRAQAVGAGGEVERDVVTAEGTDDEGRLVSASDDHSVAFTAVIDLEVTTAYDPTTIALDTDPALGPNEQTVLTVVVINNGPSAATDVVVSVPVPPGLIYISHDCSPAASVGAVCSYDPGTGLLTLGTVGVGASATLEISVGVGAAGTFPAEAEVVHANEPDIDSTPNNNVATEDDQDPDVIVVTQVLASSSIGDLVFNDLNLNGVLDAGEPGVAGATVQLTNLESAAVTSTVTGSDGRYLFAALPIGTFTVQVVTATAPAGLSPTTTTSYAIMFVTDGESFLDADFGFGAEQLPRTGGDTARALWLAQILLGLGTLILLGTRKRNRELLSSRPRA
jgi:uncharacterized repeat protein (TIGR01451 family)